MSKAIANMAAMTRARDSTANVRFLGLRLLRHCHVGAASPDRMGDACERSSAGTRRCLEPASNGRFMGSAGRHHATGRWRAALARHPRYAVFGIGAGTAVLAGVVMVALPGHS